jgi:hypothetical protein
MFPMPHGLSKPARRRALTALCYARLSALCRWLHHRRQQNLPETRRQLLTKPPRAAKSLGQLGIRDGAKRGQSLMNRRPDATLLNIFVAVPVNAAGTGNLLPRNLGMTFLESGRQGRETSEMISRQRVAA